MAEKTKKLRIIIGCEFSQIVMSAFLEKGHDAYSCDIIPCEGDYPERHYQMDILELLKKEKFDLGIFHPPCTYLTIRGQYHNKRLGRDKEKKAAIEFFLKLMNAPIKRIALENPVGIMNTLYRKPDQIIQPFYFGDPHRKRTCLWLKNLPKLIYTEQDTLFEKKTIVKEKIKYWTKNGKPVHWVDSFSPSKNRQKLRSKTFQGIANVFAAQWS